GGKMLAEDGTGSITVIGGKYSADPGTFVADGYKATQRTDGSFLVEEDEGNVDITDPTYVAQVGDNKYETLADALAAAEDGATIKLLRETTENLPGNKNVTYDLGGFILDGTLSVDAGKEVTIQNGTLTGDIAVSGKLTLGTGTVTGKINLLDGSTLNVSAEKVSTGDISAEGRVTVNISNGSFGTLEAKSGSTITGNVTGGTFKAIPEVFLAEGYEAVKDRNGYTVRKKETPAATATVKDTNGNVYDSNLTNSSTVHFFKGSTQVNNTDLIFLKDTTFVLDQKLSSLSAGGTALTSGTDYKYEASTGKLSIVTSAANLNNLSAGLRQLSFTFENGAKVNVPLRVWPEVSFASAEHVIGSGKNFVISVSDQPGKVSFGSSSATDTHKDVDSSNILTSTTGFEIKSSYMDTLTPGAQIIGLWYDNLPIMYQITVKAAVTVVPTDDNKDAKWYYGDGVLKFDVSEKLTGVSVDNSVIDSKNYSVNDDGILTLKAAFLKTLAYGEHSLTVSTAYGSASTKFTTAPSVVAKNGSNHTKGGSTDLVFTSSDAVTEVYVGSKKLDSAIYPLSSDGKTITLKAAFLNTLKADTTYTLTVKGNAGTASTTFKILSPGSAAANPKTGDESNIALWAVVLVLSGAAAAALMPKKKKQ
ncbi:MAG: polymer-forming cytoskeletal protein, partial [Sutterellaceae bacterium]|nr:polymer-forming cytoskeletal protein [Sutterellaceae bacterium]